MSFRFSPKLRYVKLTSHIISNAYNEMERVSPLVTVLKQTFFESIVFDLFDYVKVLIMQYLKADHVCN